MQDNLSPKPKKISFKGLSVTSLVCGIVTLVILLSCAIFSWSSLFSQVETRQGRIAGETYPKKTEQFTIKSVDTCWKSTDGDDRLALRASFCPYVTIKLGDVQAAGTFYCYFVDASNKSIGHLISIAFTPDGFVETNDTIVHAKGDTAHIMLDQGFMSKDDFYVHVIDEAQPLWRFYIDYKMNDSNVRTQLGFSSIKALNAATIDEE